MNNFYYFIIVFFMLSILFIGSKLWILETSNRFNNNIVKHELLKKHANFISILLAISSLIFFSVKLYYYDFKNIHEVLQLTWISLSDVNVYFVLKDDFTTNTWIFSIALLTAFTVIYSFENINKLSGKLVTQICLFSLSMFLLTSSSNLIQIYFGWELISLISYILINFYNEKSEQTKNTAFRIFLINKIGDVFFLFAIVLIYVHYRTFDLEKLSETKLLYTFNVKTIACLLFLLAVSVKSAQLGWSKWLKDAMIAPTPVSALLHSATLVSAGVFLLIKIQNTIGMHIYLKNLFLVYSACTAIYASINTLYENDIKRILACSTIAEISIMLCATCFGATKFATMFFIIHAVAKVSLFFAAGNIINSLLGETNIKKMGALMNELPCTYTFMLVPCLLIVGAIPFGISIGTEIQKQYLYIFNAIACISSLFLILAFTRMIYFIFHKEIQEEIHINYSLAEKNNIVITTCSSLLLISIIIRAMLFIHQSIKTGFYVDWVSILLKSIGIFTAIHLAKNHFFENSILFNEKYEKFFSKKYEVKFNDETTKYANTILKNITNLINNRLFLKIYNIACFKLNKLVSSMPFSAICYAFSVLFLIIFLAYTMK